MSAGNSPTDQHCKAACRHCYNLGCCVCDHCYNLIDCNCVPSKRQERVGEFMATQPVAYFFTNHPDVDV